MIKEKGDRREMIVSCQRWGGRLSSRDVRYWHLADIGASLELKERQYIFYLNRSRARYHARVILNFTPA